jgi:S1-C subfamily serine protease
MFANVEITLYRLSDGNKVKIENKDILFEKNLIQFQLLSDCNQKVKIFSNIHKEQTLLKILTLPKGIPLYFPVKNEYIEIDKQKGKLSFQFKTKSQTQKFSFVTNPDIISIDQNSSKVPIILYSTKRIYIDETKVISNDRGDKEVNIIIPKLESSTVVVSSDGHIGTGVIINQGNNILTNYHVVAPDQKNVYIALKPEIGDNPAKNNYYKAKVLKVDMIRDLALLEMPKSVQKNHKFGFLKFGNIKKMKKGIDIYTMGHPHKYFFAFEYGMLNKIVKNYRWITYKVDYALHYSMTSNRGNSGGPIINDKLELLGIVAGSDLSGQNLNFGISIADIKHFLKAKESVVIKRKPLSTYTKYIMQKGLYKNARFAKIDRNGNGKPDAMMKDVNGDGKWDIIAYDTDEDGSYERVTSY